MPVETTAPRNQLPRIEARKIEDILVDNIHPDPDQPRKRFDSEKLQELAKSSKMSGLVQLPVVQLLPGRPDHYRLVAGERRWRAAKINGDKTIPCMVVWGKINPFVLSAVENFCRVDLNPIEEAETLKRLHDDQAIAMTWQEISDLMGRSVPTIHLKLRLLELPITIQEMIREGRLPQATALNLAQYQTRTGDLLRLAHDLIAGKTPLELVANAAPLQEKRERQHLAATPEDNFRRILKWAWTSTPAISAMEEFLKLSVENQEVHFKKLSPQSQKSFAEYIEAIARAAGSMHTALSRLSPPKIKK